MRGIQGLEEDRGAATVPCPQRFSSTVAVNQRSSCWLVVRDEEGGHGEAVLPGDELQGLVVEPPVQGQTMAGFPEKIAPAKASMW